MRKKLTAILETENYVNNNVDISWENIYFKDVTIGIAISNIELTKNKIILATNEFLRDVRNEVVVLR